MPENEAVLQQTARSISRSGFRLPALLALEIGRPLAFLMGQFLWVAQPTLSLILPRHDIGQIARLLEEPAAVERLIRYLETE